MYNYHSFDLVFDYMKKKIIITSAIDKNITMLCTLMYNYLFDIFYLRSIIYYM